MLWLVNSGIKLKMDTAFEVLISRCSICPRMGGRTDKPLLKGLSPLTSHGRHDKFGRYHIVIVIAEV